MTAYFVFISMHLIILLASISVNAVSVAFDDIRQSMGASLVAAGWVFSIYLLVFTISTVVTGKISDILGRKQVFMVCVGLFVTGSIIAALAPNIQVLILARLVQALGGGGFVPVTLGIITEMFPHSRQKMVGISISVFNFGGILGPGIGAWLVTTYGWHSVFWFNVPFGILAVIPIFFLLKPGQRTQTNIDWAGAGLLAGTLAGIMIGLSRINITNSLAEWAIAGFCLLAGAACLRLFWWHELKAREPIVDLALLKLKPFVAANIFNFIYGACIFSFSSFIPLFVTSVYGLSSYQSGLVLSFRSGGTIIAAMAASFLVMRWGYRKQIMFGTVLISVTILLMAAEPAAFTLWGLHFSDILILSTLGFFSGIAVGMVAPALVNCLIDLMPERTATIGGLGSVFRQAGGAIFITLTTVTVQSITSRASGFMLSFAIMGVLVLACLPFIFAMPERGDKLSEASRQRYK